MSTILRLKCNPNFTFTSVTGLDTKVHLHLVLPFLSITDRYLLINYLCKIWKHFSFTKDCHFFKIKYKISHCFDKSASVTSMTVLYTEPICTSLHSPSLGVKGVNTGTLLQEPERLLIMTRNCSPTALNGVMLSKFVVPAGKSSNVSATA